MEHIVDKLSWINNRDKKYLWSKTYDRLYSMQNRGILKIGFPRVRQDLFIYFFTCPVGQVKPNVTCLT